MRNGQVHICATITGSSTEELRARRDAVGDADLVELRLDTPADPDAGAAIHGRSRPVIVTCRSAVDGGWFPGDEGARRTLLLDALDKGAEYVDLEWGRGFEDVVRRRRGRNIVLSMHDFTEMPRDLETRVDAMMGSGADVVKVAVMVSRVADCARLKAISRRHSRRRIVLIGMGEAGLATRICPARFGSCWTYAGEGVAPGQVSLEQLHREYRIRRIGPDTAIFGIAGRPVGHSLSPAIQNAAFEQLGIDAVYVPLAAADVDDVFEGADAIGLAGASVTAPYKEAVMARLAGVDAEAARIGAVNTLVRRPDGWHGLNTDAAGFLSGCDGVALTGRRVAVLGTGGAARALAAAARGAGAFVTCYGRDRVRAQAVADALGVEGAMRPVPAQSWDVLVNATPVGTHPDAAASAFPEGTYDGGIVYDLVYNPPLTRFMRDASLSGCRTIGGLEMLVAQARLQVEHWTGRVPGPGAMREAALWKLSHLADGT